MKTSNSACEVPYSERLNQHGSKCFVQDARMGFAQWLDQAFPADTRLDRDDQSHQYYSDHCKFIGSFCQGHLRTWLRRGSEGPSALPFVMEVGLWLVVADRAWRHGDAGRGHPCAWAGVSERYLAWGVCQHGFIRHWGFEPTHRSRGLSAWQSVSQTARSWRGGMWHCLGWPARCSADSGLRLASVILQILNLISMCCDLADSELISMCWGDVLPPFSVAYVKGWRRSVTCLVVADAIRTLNIDDSVLLPQYKVRYMSVSLSPFSLFWSSVVRSPWLLSEHTHMNPPQVDWVFVFHIPARIPWDLSMLQLGTTPMCKIKCLLPEAAQRWGFTLEWLDSFLSCTWWNFVGLDYFWAVTWSNFVAGISITSTLRRPPNCFNLLRQHEVFSRANVAAEATAASKLHVDVACLRWFWFDYGVFATGNFLVNCVRLYYNMYIPHIFTTTF